MFVDFFHAHRPDAAPAPWQTAVHLTEPASGPAALPDYSCPICAWLRIGPKLESPHAIGPCTQIVTALAAPARVACAESPIPLPARFRGPPRHFFA
jgi:hypothetical protein